MAKQTQAQKHTQTEGKTVLYSTSIRLTDTLRRAVKIKAAIEGKRIQQIVIDLLTQYVKK